MTTEALAVGTLGTVGRNKYLVGVSGALGTTSYGFAAAWLGWTPQGFVAITSVVGAVLLTVWTAAFLGRRLPERFELWLPTIAVVGHVAGLAVFAVAFLEFDLQQSAGVAAAVLGFEALLSGVVATARRNSSLVDLASLLAASSYGLVAVWGDWSSNEVVGVTAIVGGALLAVWTVFYIRGASSAYARLWFPNTGILAQAAVAVIILVASGEFSDPSFAGVLAGVAAAEALVAGLIGTRLDRQPLVWASAGLLAAAYGLTAEWLAWETATLISITAIAGGALTTAFAIGYLRGVDSNRISMWLYPVGAAGQAAAISVIVMAAASDAPQIALGIASGVALAEAVLVGTIAIAKQNAILAPVATGFAAASYGLFAGWRDWTAVTVVGTTSAIGAVLLITWMRDLLSKVDSDQLRMWMPSIGAAGATGAIVTGAVAVAEFPTEGAAGVFAGLAWFAAGMAGTVASARTKPVLASVATALFALGYGLGAVWLQWDAETFVAVTGPVGAAGVLGTTFAYLTGRGSPAARLWLPSTAVASQFALLGTIAVAASGMETREMAAVIAVVAAFESVVVGVVAAARRNRLAAAASTALAGVAYWFMTLAIDVQGADLVWLIGGFTAAAAAAATVITRSADTESRTALWEIPAHGLAALGVFMTAASSILELSSNSSLAALAIVSLAAGTYVAVNVPFAPEAWGLALGVGPAYVAASGFLMAWSTRTETSQSAIIFGIAALGLAAAAIRSAAGLDVRWRAPRALSATGFELTALIGAAAGFGYESSEFAAVLLIAGGAVMAHGLLGRRPGAVQVELVMWLIAGLLLIDERLTLTLHGAVVLLSATLLAVIEVERHRPDFDKLTRRNGLVRAE